MGVEIRPTAAQLRAARESAGQSQAQAAAVVYAGLRTWSRWESGDILMPAAEWALYRLRTRQITLDSLET